MEGTFTDAHERWWNAARRAHGDAAGTKELIEALLAHRHIPHEDLGAGLRAALAAGALTADAVKILTRQLAERPTIAHRDAPGILLPLPPAPAPGDEQEHLAPVIELRPTCPLRARCTKAKAGRVLAIRPHHDQQAAARHAATHPDWQARYRRWRPPVERAVAWLVDHGNRRLRYRGTIANNTWIHTRAAALNLRTLINLGLTRTHGRWSLPSTV